MAEAKRRVLIMDDDEAIRTSVRMVLEPHGYEVDGAVDGEQGVFLQEGSPFDIAIIDMMMPNKDGIEVIRELRTVFPDLFILAISGGTVLGKINYLDLAETFGADAILNKPFGADDLLSALTGTTQNVHPV